jgi:hypothetical protein
MKALGAGVNVSMPEMLEKDSTPVNTFFVLNEDCVAE